MAQMTPEEMAQMQQGGGEDQAGKATKLAQQVAQGLVELQGMLAKSQGVTDQDIAQMDDVVMKFADLVEKKLAGAAPGEDVEEESPEMNQVPADAGMSGKPLGPQVKN
jgi:uncharacterized coiled-coil protein SlyX